MTSTFRLTGRLLAAISRIAPTRALITVLLAFALGCAEGIALLAIAPLLQQLGLDAAGPLAPIVSAFQDGIASLGLTFSLPLMLGVCVALVSIQAVLQREQAVSQTALGDDVAHGLRLRLYRAIQGTSWTHFSTMHTSSFTELLTQRVDRVGTAVRCLFSLFGTLVIAGVYAAVAVRVSPELSILVLSAGVALGLAIGIPQMAARRARQVHGEALARLQTAASDHLHSFKLARSHNLSDRHTAHFSDISRELVEASRGFVDAGVAVRMWGTVGGALALAVTVYAAHDLLQMPSAALFLLIVLFACLAPRVVLAYGTARVFGTEVPALDAVLDAERECLAEAKPQANGTEPEPEPFTLEAGLDCRGVTFRYPGAGTDVLRNVDVTVPVRATTAIVGPAGAGKSTLADVLMGVVTPQTGRLRLDGAPLTSDRFEHWRLQIGYVSQDPLLFHDTIRNNLLWAKPDAEEADLRTALTRAAADDFVRALPKDIDTVIGEGGVQLSAGERQRLSLARELLRKPKLLIVDEATGALQSEDEQLIQHALEWLHGQITIVIISQRLATVRSADIIYVMERGEVVEWGSWSKLFKAGRKFRSMCDAQGLSAAENGEKRSGDQDQNQAQTG